MKAGFSSISIDEFVKATLKANPKDKMANLRESVLAALKDYKNGVKCQCGQGIWVVGSSIVGNACFTCITGEAFPDDDYEIDEAM